MEFETECIARAVADEAEPEPSVYFLGEAMCTAANTHTLAHLCVMMAHPVPGWSREDTAASMGKGCQGRKQCCHGMPMHGGACSFRAVPDV